MRIEKLTHKGWFLLCPIYMTDITKPQSAVCPRWFWLSPVYWVSIKLFWLICEVVFRFGYRGSLDPVRITGTAPRQAWINVDE